MGKILIIDDDVGLRDVISRLLANAGHETRTVSGLEQGLALLKDSAFDLIYCDVRLHNESGFKLFDVMNTLPNQPLIIMITGFPSLDTARKALRDGAFDYLVKPILEEDLLLSASRALSAKTFQNEKEHMRLHLEAVLYSVEEALFSVSQDLILLSVNRAAERVCGLRQEDLNRPITDLLDHCHGQCLVAMRHSLQEGKNVSLPRLACQRSEYQEQVVTVTASPLRDARGVTLGAVMAVKDETRLVSLEKSLEQRSRFHRLVGQSAPMQAMYRLIENLTNVETTVLLTGESGTGKELVAEAIHGAGSRASHPLVKVNCVALSETLLESELFGHVRGAFTGAVRDRVGRFQEAHLGTLLLDEIGDISPALQMRLLRVLQEKQFERVGDNKTMDVDVRIVAATNKDLQEKVDRGLFREDLYYRLNVVEVRVPSLRQRMEDISLLVDHFIAYFNIRFGRNILGVSEPTLAALMRYPWPGNVRELAHAIEHAFVLCRQSTIDLSHLPKEFQPRADHIDERLSLPDPTSAPERKAILAALSATQWNRDRAARQIGMSRSTFYRRMKQLGIVQKEE